MAEKALAELRKKKAAKYTAPRSSLEPSPSGSTSSPASVPVQYKISMPFSTIKEKKSVHFKSHYSTAEFTTTPETMVNESPMAVYLSGKLDAFELARVLKHESDLSVLSDSATISGTNVSIIDYPQDLDERQIHGLVANNSHTRMEDANEDPPPAIVETHTDHDDTYPPSPSAADYAPLPPEVSISPSPKSTPPTTNAPTIGKWFDHGFFPQAHTQSSVPTLPSH